MTPTEILCCGPKFWLYFCISVGLVLFAGIMSGLTLGLMSLSLVDLEVLIKAGQPADRRNAAKILPVVKNQHLLLCTLLIGNSMAMEALPVFLDALVAGWVAILISVTLILVFGEIIPQAVCTHYGLRVGAKMAGVVQVLLVVFFPVAYPISKLLDWILGKGHFALMRRAELKTLVDMHGNEAGKGGELTHDETTIIAGALELTQKTAKDAMTAISEIFSLDINSKLDMYTMGLIMNKGHSRVPIYSGSPTNIIGLILVKNLLTCRAEEEIPIANVTIRKIPRVYDDLPLYDILNEFQKGHSHMAVVIKRRTDTEATMEAIKTGVSESGGLKRVRHHIGNRSQMISVEHLDTNAYAVTFNATGSESNVARGKWERDTDDVRSQSRGIERGKHNNNILDFSESLPSYSSDEAVGIITMEDVMEELLQEEIWDETDDYVDLHNKIRINMLPARGALRSPKASPLYYFKRRAPATSGVSPQYRSSPMRSPLSPYPQAPLPVPSTLSSPGTAVISSSARLTCLGHSSPPSHRSC